MSLINKFLFCIFILLFSVAGCFWPTSTSRISPHKIDTYFGGLDRLVLFSCLRCQCFVKEWENIADKRGVFQVVKFFTDTGCHKPGFAFDHVSQKKIDSISTEFYNVVLLKEKALLSDTGLLKLRKVTDC